MARERRGNKRNEMTPEKLAEIRKLDRERKQRKRMSQSKDESENIRARDRERRAEARKKMDEEKKARIRVIDKERKAEAIRKMKKEDLEKFRITKLIRMRKYRLMATEGNKQLARNKAKMGMMVLRIEGPMRKYLERNKKHIWAVKWKKFLSKNPQLKELEQKKIK